VTSMTTVADEQPPIQGPPVPPEWYAYAAPRPDPVTRFVQRVWTRSPIWAAPVAMLACMGGAVGYTLATHPAAAGAGDAPTCLLKYTTGFVCPGCGGTRAAWYLLHGDLPAAARHHLLFVFAVPFLVYMYVAWAGNRLFNWRIPQFKPSPAALGVFMAAWAVFSIARNLPWAPFTSLYV
jgi:hypothetical protein